MANYIAVWIKSKPLYSLSINTFQAVVNFNVVSSFANKHIQRLNWWLRERKKMKEKKTL